MVCRYVILCVAVPVHCSLLSLFISLPSCYTYKTPDTVVTEETPPVERQRVSGGGGECSVEEDSSVGL